MAYALMHRPRGSGPAPVNRTGRHRPASRGGLVARGRRPGDLASPRVAAFTPMPVLQAKLEVGPPNDKYEQEAERAADQVMRMADPRGIGPVGAAASDGIQRICAECEEELRRQPIEDEEEKLQMQRASGAPPEIGTDLQARISGLRGGGQPLSPALRGFFEPRFGHDFGQVRIHSDASSAEIARSINARAFTIGRNVVFGRGDYAPGTCEGKRLIAHELAHVAQSAPQPLIRRQQTKPCANFADAAATIRDVEHSLGEIEYHMYIYQIKKGDNFNKLASDTLPDNTATLGQLRDELLKLNYRLGDPTNLQQGQCVVLLRNWKHINAGDIDLALQIVRESGTESTKNDLIATIYAEQSGSSINDADIQNSLNEQRMYILYSILMRIEGLEWSSRIADVLDPNKFHGKKEKNENGSPNKAFVNHYKPALEYLASGNSSKSVNVDAIEQIKTLVETIRADKIPEDAGTHYFHWSDQTKTAETEYQRAIKEADGPDTAERKAAYKHGRDVVGATMIGISEDQGWLKKIPGKNKGKDNERYGSMYIFR